MTGKPNLEIVKRAFPDSDIITTADPAVERHRKELLGTPGPAILVPPAARSVNPGNILVEWIGDTGPLASEQIVAAYRLGMIPEALWQSFIKYNRSLSTRMDGMSRRIVGPESGFNRTITWGQRPGTYVQELTYKEAERLLATPNAREFRWFEDGVWYYIPQPDLIERFLPPSLQEKARAITVTRRGPEEDLLGIVEGNRNMGYWK